MTESQQNNITPVQRKENGNKTQSLSHAETTPYKPQPSTQEHSANRTSANASAVSVSGKSSGVFTSNAKNLPYRSSSALADNSKFMEKQIETTNLKPKDGSQQHFEAYRPDLVIEKPRTSDLRTDSSQSEQDLNTPYKKFLQTPDRRPMSSSNNQNSGFIKKSMTENFKSQFNDKRISQSSAQKEIKEQREQKFQRMKTAKDPTERNKPIVYNQDGQTGKKQASNQSYFQSYMSNLQTKPRATITNDSASKSISQGTEEDEKLSKIEKLARGTTFMFKLKNQIIMERADYKYLEKVAKRKNQQKRYTMGWKKEIKTRPSFLVRAKTPSGAVLPQPIGDCKTLKYTDQMKNFGQNRLVNRNYSDQPGHEHQIFVDQKQARDNDQFCYGDQHLVDYSKLKHLYFDEQTKKHLYETHNGRRTMKNVYIDKAESQALKPSGNVQIPISSPDQNSSSYGTFLKPNPGVGGSRQSYERSSSMSSEDEKGSKNMTTQRSNRIPATNMKQRQSIRVKQNVTFQNAPDRGTASQANLLDNQAKQALKIFNSEYKVKKGDIHRGIDSQSITPQSEQEKEQSPKPYSNSQTNLDKTPDNSIQKSQKSQNQNSKENYATQEEVSLEMKELAKRNYTLKQSRMLDSKVVGTVTSSVLEMCTYKEKLKFGFIDPTNIEDADLSPRTRVALNNQAKLQEKPKNFPYHNLESSIKSYIAKPIRTIPALTRFQHKRNKRREKDQFGDEMLLLSTNGFNIVPDRHHAMMSILKFKNESDFLQNNPLAAKQQIAQNLLQMMLGEDQ